MSGPALRPTGLLAVRKVRAATPIPLVGVGGVGTAADAVAYARLGASLVEVGTASFADPRSGPRIARELATWGRRHRVDSWHSLLPPLTTSPSA